MDKATFLGIGIAAAGVIGGDLIEGGKIQALIQPTAFMIVVGGTIGATMVQFPLKTFIRAIKGIKRALTEPADPSHALVEEVVKYATIARKDGILALEPLVPKASDPFLVRALTMAVDGADTSAMRETLEASMHHEEEDSEDVAKVFEAAGGDRKSTRLNSSHRT